MDIDKIFIYMNNFQEIKRLRQIAGIKEAVSEKKDKELAAFLENWLEGTEQFEKLKNSSDAEKLLSHYPQFQYSGKMFRFLGSKVQDQPVDLSSGGIKSFSRTLDGIATIADMWHYGGMIEGDVDNLPVYMQTSKGFDIPKAIKYLISKNLMDKELWDTLQYVEQEEIISKYNSPVLKYVLCRPPEDFKSPCGSGYAPMQLVTPQVWKKGGRIGRTVCSRSFIW